MLKATDLDDLAVAMTIGLLAAGFNKDKSNHEMVKEAYEIAQALVTESKKHGEEPA